MNRVVSVEIAGQVFWIDEYAFDVLVDYLNEIKQQLANDDGSEEILDDIELRIAELLYGFNNNNKQAISLGQVDSVIKQVGYIYTEPDSDGEEENIEIGSPRKSFLDPKNRIIGGVCSGLSMRFRIPAFILRIIFIALSFIFGLGIVLYLIFWMSLDSITSRNATLASQGKPQTARHIASVKETKAPPEYQIQKIIFLPFTVIGYILMGIGNQLRKRNITLIMVFKTIFAAILIFFSILVCIALLYLNAIPIFSTSITWLLNLSIVYLTVLGLVIYFLEDYFTKPVARVGKRLKVGAIIPAFIILYAVAEYGNEYSYKQNESIERNYLLSSGTLNIDYNVVPNPETYPNNVDIKLKSKPFDNSNLKISLDYVSHGSDEVDALENIQGIKYTYTFENNTLTLNNRFFLEEGTNYRDQDVNVVLEIPQNIRFHNPVPLQIRYDGNSYSYRFLRSYNEGQGYYFSSGGYLHEADSEFRNRASRNEKSVLLDKFCKEFFIRDVWTCRSNIRRPIEKNWFFDRAFKDDMGTIEEIRKYLVPYKTLLLSNLKDINELTKKFTVENQVKSEFQNYLEHLIKIKSTEELFKP